MTGAHHAVPATIPGTVVWSADMTVGAIGNVLGYSSSLVTTIPHGALDPTAFDRGDGTTLTVSSVAYGLSKATVLATSVLAVGQDAASSAAHEGTTGNLSLGNTSHDTHRYGTLEGRQVRTSMHVDTDRYTGYAPGGSGFTAAGDGTVITDAGVATSRIPAAGVRLSESLATSHEARAAEARTLSRHWSAEAGQARNAAVTDATALVERYARDVSTGEAFARGVTESDSAQVQALESHYEKMSETAGITRDQAAVLVGEAKVGGGFSKIIKIGADGSARWRGQTIEKESWDRLQDYAEQHQVLDQWSRVSEASRRYSTATGESEAASLDESVSANLTRMQRFEERASLARQESESWSEQAAQVRSEAQAIDRELGQPFFVWLSEREGADGHAGGVEVYRTEDIELRAGDRIRWTRNDAGLGLVNSQTAEVAAVRDGRVSFRLGDGRMLDLASGDPQLRHVDRAWASTVHAFQGRTVDTVIAAMEANHPHLTTHKAQVATARLCKRGYRRTRCGPSGRLERRFAVSSELWKPIVRRLQDSAGGCAQSGCHL